jgi:PAS domain S-box-containing protein
MSGLEKEVTGRLPKAFTSAAGDAGVELDSPGYAAFRALFDSSGEALVVIDQAGTIQTANSHALEVLQASERGLARSDLANSVLAPNAERLRSLSRGQRFMASARGADRAAVGGDPISVTLRSILPVSQHLLLCLEDSSGDRDQRIEWLEAELRAVLDSIPMGILILNRLGRIRRANPHFAELLGLRSRELENIQNLKELTPLIAGRLRNVENLAARWRAFDTGHGEPVHDDLEISGPRPRLLERFSRAITDAEGRSLGWLEVYSDVTEHRQIQLKMLQTEKMAALGEVAAGIAHELNNPLTAILGNVQLLLGHPLNDTAMVEARRVHQEAERARRIVKNLLYFARENKPERSAVDLNEIAERTLALRGYELKNENIRVETDLAPDLPRTMADPYQLQQVVLNLLMNAEQALLESRGQGVVRIRTGHSAQKTGHRIWMELSDNGPGIPAEIAPRIFDPFFTTKAPGVGTGLGLSIVYGIVRQHEGEVTFESEPGAGAKFIIELPVVPPPAADAQTESRDRRGHSPAVKGSSILVVEDESTVADLIVDVLHEDRHRVHAVLDSREGLELLSRRSYDLVICDLRMPWLDGRSFFKAIQRARNPMQHKILFITGDTLSPSTVEFLEANRLPFLAKPFLVEELKLAVRQQLAANRGRAKKGGKRSVRA